MMCWICPECGRENSPALRDCPSCPPASAQPSKPVEATSTYANGGIRASDGILALAHNLETIHAFPILATVPEQLAEFHENGHSSHVPATATLTQESALDPALQLTASFNFDEEVVAPTYEAMLVLAEETLAIPLKESVDSLVRPLVESLELTESVESVELVAPPRQAVAEDTLPSPISVETEPEVQAREEVVQEVVAPVEVPYTELKAEPVDSNSAQEPISEPSQPAEFCLAEQPPTTAEEPPVTLPAAPLESYSLHAMIDGSLTEERAQPEQPTAIAAVEETATQASPIDPAQIIEIPPTPAVSEAPQNPEVLEAQPTEAPMVVSPALPESASAPEVGQPEAPTQADPINAPQSVEAETPQPTEIADPEASANTPPAPPESASAPEVGQPEAPTVAAAADYPTQAEPINAPQFVEAEAPQPSETAEPETSANTPPAPLGSDPVPADTTQPEQSPTTPAPAEVTSQDRVEVAASQAEGVAHLEQPISAPSSETPSLVLPVDASATFPEPAEPQAPEPTSGSTPSDDFALDPPASGLAVPQLSAEATADLAAPVSDAQLTIDWDAPAGPPLPTVDTDEISAALAAEAEEIVEVITRNLEIERAAIRAVAASFERRCATSLLSAPSEIVKAPAPPVVEWFSFSDPHHRPIAPPPANLDSLTAGPQSPTLAGPCLPPELRNPTESPVAKTSRKSRSMPGWVVSFVAAMFLLLIVVTLFRYYNSQSDGTASTPAQSGSQTTAAQAEAIAGSLEISGLRLVKSWSGKQQIRFLIINHSAQDLSGVTAQVTVKSDGSPVLLIQAPIRYLASNQSKEVRTDLDSDVPASALSDWQALRTEIRLTTQQ